uniref:Protein kinase domain-containing protein n=1 Tax=Mesocestoides corti TaxID=53468 RepID=A0A5K3F6C2_MESCO
MSSDVMCFRCRGVQGQRGLFFCQRSHHRLVPSRSHNLSEHHHKKRQETLYPIPAKLLSPNEVNPPICGTHFIACHLHCIGAPEPGGCLGSLCQMPEGCPFCKPQLRNQQYCSDTDISGIQLARAQQFHQGHCTCHANVRLLPKTSNSFTANSHQYHKSRPVNHYQVAGKIPLRISPARVLSYKSDSELAPSRSSVHSRSGQNDGGWVHEPVQLVYENHLSPTAHGHPGSRRQSEPGHQPTKGFHSELPSHRMNGASKVLYASKQGASGRLNGASKSSPNGNMPLLTVSSSEMFSESSISLPQPQTVRKQDAAYASPPQSSQRPYGPGLFEENRIKFDYTKPAGIPYFDSSTPSNAESNGSVAIGRTPRHPGPQPSKNFLQDSNASQPPTSGIGFREDGRRPPSQKAPKDPSLNASFKFQCGADPQIAPDPQEAPPRQQGVPPEIKIQARSKTSTDSSSSFPTDTPVGGGNALDDTLNTEETIPLPRYSRPSSPRTPQPPISPSSSENSEDFFTRLREKQSQGTLTDEEDSRNSNHPYEMILNFRPDDATVPGFKLPVQDNGNLDQVGFQSLASFERSSNDYEQQMSAAMMKPGNLPPPPEDNYEDTLLVPKGENHMNKTNGTQGPPVSSAQPKPPGQTEQSFDLTTKVSHPVGNLIHQRLKELTMSLGVDPAPSDRDYSASKQVTPGNKTVDPRIERICAQNRTIESIQQVPPLNAGNKPQPDVIPESQRFERWDKGINLQFGSLTKDDVVSPSSVDYSMTQITPPGWREDEEPLYENVSASRTTESLISRRVRELGGKQVHHGPQRDTLKPLNGPIEANPKGGHIQPVQRGQLVSQRMKELAAATGYSQSPVSTTPGNHRKTEIEEFRLVAVLGQGNFGKVLLAEQTGKQQYYALKTFKKVELLREKNVECLATEKRVLQVITEARHPFFAHMKACLQSKDYAVIVLDYIPGGDLMQHIQQGPFSEERTLFYSACVVLALEFLHSRNIMYRDLKLENLLLTANGYLKLVDFGLCKEGMGPHDETSTFCGTPEFLAPEMLNANGYTRAADWWSLGVLIYEMLLGKCPFSGIREEDVYDSILRSEAKIPINIGWKAGDIIRKFLQKNPTRRLGAVPAGVAEVKAQPFFSGINFDLLLAQKLQPPFAPTLVNMEDVSNFDKRHTSEKARFTPPDRSISPHDDKRYFANFDYF